MLQKAVLVITGLLFFIGVTIAQPQLGPQITEISGKVIDASTREPLPYAAIRLIGANGNTFTNPKGEYFVHTTGKVDSISFSFTGFATKTVAVQRGKVQELNVALGDKAIEIPEIQIKPGKKKGRQIDTAANYVFYKVLEHKSENRSQNLNSYKFDSYDKLQFALLNTSDKFINFWLFKPFKFVFKNVDSTETHDAFIPGLLKEQISEVYYRKHPKSSKKYVRADAFSGINNASINRFAEYHFAEIDAYDNLFVIALTSFVGPFASNAMATYRYYLTDTARIDGRVSYKLQFVGRVKEDLALKGWAWIDSATWAIRTIVFRPNERANFNFVNDYTIKQDFTIVQGKYWIMDREQMNTVGSLFKKKNKMAILVTKTHDRKNIDIDVAIPDSIFKGPEEQILLDSARQRPVTYWDTARFEPLTTQERQVYKNIDSIKSLRIWRFYQSLGRFASAAYADAGPISIGRVLNFVSKNNVDGWRLRFGFETNPRFKNPGNPIHDFFHTFYFNVYAAYGLSDRLLHYQAMMRIALPKINDRWQVLEAMYRYDFRVPGQDEDQTVLTFDNVLTLLSGTTISKFMNVREYRFGYERDWFKDFSMHASFNEKIYYGIPGVVDFTRPVPGETKPQAISNFGVTEFFTEFRYSRNDLYYADLFYRFFQSGTKYPIFLFRYTLSMVNMQGDYFANHNFTFTLKQRLSSPIGHTNYIFKAGEILGRVPYTASYLTQGNLGILYDKFNYSLLSEFEFVSNQYASFWFDHHFDGFFFNKIPGFNKLKLREVVGIKSLIGAYNQKDANVLTPPGATINSLGQVALTGIKAPGPIPYLEASAGIENILYVARVDFVWRVTYRNKAFGPLWGIKLAISPGF